MSEEKAWFTIPEVAALLHVGGRTTLRMLEPHRGQCHLARRGKHPRLVLWIPAKVVSELCESRSKLWWPEDPRR